MKKITLRTKVEVIVLVSLFIALSTSGVFAVTRTISSTQDSVYSLIRNTNGKVWDVSQANLQAAINDLNNASGTVWVGSDFSTSATTIVHNMITIDLSGHRITYTGTSHCVQLRWGSRIQNGCIDMRYASIDNNDAAIYVDGIDRIGMRMEDGEGLMIYASQATGASHMVLVSGSTGALHIQKGSGIFLDCNSTTVPKNIYFTRWDDISTAFFKYGFRLEAWGKGAYDECVNSNYFVNCFDDCSNISFYLHMNTAISHDNCGVDGNSFLNCATEGSSGYWATYSKYCLYNQGQYNNFDIMCWDWQTGQGGPGRMKYYFGTGASYNYAVLSGDFTSDVGGINSLSFNIYNMKSEGKVYGESWNNI
jgi:hypothetical protein